MCSCHLAAHLINSLRCSCIVWRSDTSEKEHAMISSENDGWPVESADYLPWTLHASVWFVCRNQVNCAQCNCFQVWLGRCEWLANSKKHTHYLYNDVHNNVSMWSMKQSASISRTLTYKIHSFWEGDLWTRYVCTWSILSEIILRRSLDK